MIWFENQIDFVNISESNVSKPCAYNIQLFKHTLQVSHLEYIMYISPKH